MSLSKKDLKGKRAVLYIRVSTEDQAEKGYSLRDQEERLRSYCEKNDLKVVALFREEGASAKSFNRPKFNQFLNLTKEMKYLADYFLVSKWDRFSRNMEQALSMIKKLQKKGIETNCIDQWIDFEDPNHSLLLAIHLATPQVENDVRSEKVFLGMRRAKKEGIWMTRAPKGYKRVPDGIGKSKLVPGEDAPFIKEAFERVAEGVYSLDQLRRELVDSGWTCSKPRFLEIIRNPIYISKMVVPAYKDEPEELVDCVHEPIVSEECFYKAQSRLGKVRHTRKVKLHDSEDFVLRGFLCCPNCDTYLYASRSKSAGVNHYYYYHCNPCQVRHRADLANKAFVDFLGTFVFPSEVMDLYKKILYSICEEKKTNKKESLIEIDSQIKSLDAKVLKLELKYVDEEIEKDSFERVKASYQKEMVELNNRKSLVKSIDKDYEKVIDFSVSLLSRLDLFYEEVSIDGKRSLISSIFGEKLLFRQNNF